MATALTKPPYGMYGSLGAMTQRKLMPLLVDGAPTDGTSGTYANAAGKGCLLIDVTNAKLYMNTGTLASPIWSDLSTIATADFAAGAVDSAAMDDNLIKVVSGTILSADITGTGTGQLGHANGVPLIATGGAAVVTEFVSLLLAMDFATAAYTGGANLGVKISAGGAALSGVVTAANFIQVAADKVVQLVPLAATFVTPTINTGINLVDSSAPTQPGTAAGVIRWSLRYRRYATGL